jgi:hypothetical protein
MRADRGRGPPRKRRGPGVLARTSEAGHLDAGQRSDHPTTIIAKSTPALTAAEREGHLLAAAADAILSLGLRPPGALAWLVFRVAGKLRVTPVEVGPGSQLLSAEGGVQ